MGSPRPPGEQGKGGGQNYSLSIYAYSEMTNHVYLVIDPGDNAESLSKFMKLVAERQTRYANKLEGRSGSLCAVSS